VTPALAKVAEDSNWCRLEDEAVRTWRKYMPNIKQQAIHPAIDIPHAEGILALAAEPIEKDQLVFPFGL